MSYFHGQGVTNFDSFVDRRARRRHGKQRIPPNCSDSEPVRGTRHRRKHVSGRKPPVTRDAEPEDEKDSSPKSKSRRHLHREIQRLVEENRVLASKLELSLLDSNIHRSVTDERTEKDALITKLRKKNVKLEKTCQEIDTEREKLKIFQEQRENEYRQLHVHHEELTQILQRSDHERSNLLTVNQRFKSENTRLSEDVNLLKNLVFRLNVELERYQDKLRQSGQCVKDVEAVGVTDNVDTVPENKKNLESWGRVNVHALGPLLDAYQENLSEKDELIRRYGKEIDEFGGRCKDVVAENEMLHKEIERFNAKFSETTVEMEAIAKDAAVVKEQNDLLKKQAVIQKQKLQEIHSVYERKVESMSEDNNKLHNDYLACKTDLSNLQGKYEILNEGYEKLKSNSEKTMPVSVHTAAVEECKRLFEELKSRYESEKRKLNSRIEYLEETQPENEKQLITTIAERDQLKTSVKSLEKNLKQHKLEHLRNSMYSIQVSRDSLKRQLNKTTIYCEELIMEQEKLMMERDKLAALLREREKENENIQYLGDNIVHRMGNLKSRLKSVQKGTRQQLATVEQHMQNQELGLDQIKAEYRLELQRLRELLKQKEDVIGVLQREKLATQDNLELVWRAATSDDKKVKDALRHTKPHHV